MGEERTDRKILRRDDIARRDPPKGKRCDAAIWRTGSVRTHKSERDHINLGGTLDDTT